MVSCHVDRSVLRGTEEANTIPGFISPVLSWAPDRRMVISHFQPILPKTMYAMAQVPVEEHMVCAPLRRSLTVMIIRRVDSNQTKLFYQNANEVKDDMK